MTSRTARRQRPADNTDTDPLSASTSTNVAKPNCSWRRLTYPAVRGARQRQATRSAMQQPTSTRASDGTLSTRPHNSFRDPTARRPLNPNHTAASRPPTRRPREPTTPHPRAHHATPSRTHYAAPSRPDHTAPPREPTSPHPRAASRPHRIAPLDAMYYAACTTPHDRVYYAARSCTPFAGPSRNSSTTRTPKSLSMLAAAATSPMTTSRWSSAARLRISPIASPPAGFSGRHLRRAPAPSRKQAERSPVAVVMTHKVFAGPRLRAYARGLGRDDHSGALSRKSLAGRRSAARRAGRSGRVDGHHARGLLCGPRHARLGRGTAAEAVPMTSPKPVRQQPSSAPATSRKPRRLQPALVFNTAAVLATTLTAAARTIKYPDAAGD